MLDPRDIERAAQRQRVLEWEANERKLAGYIADRSQRLSLVPIAVIGWQSSSTTANHKTCGTVRPVQRLVLRLRLLRLIMAAMRKAFVACLPR